MKFAISPYIFLLFVLVLGSCGGSGTTENSQDLGDTSNNPDILDGQGTLDNLEPDGKDAADATADFVPEDQLDALEITDTMETIPDDADVADVADVEADTLGEELDRLFPGIRPECRPVDLGCVDDGSCLETQKCVGSRCVNALSPDDYTFAADVLKVGSLVLPSGSAGGAFDYNGDGVPDNALADAVALFDGGADLVNRTLNDYFSSGQYT